MQRLKNSIFLQEAYSEGSNEYANDWDLFLYESMVEHSYKPDHKPLLILLFAMFDAHVLTELGDEVSSKSLSKLDKNTQYFYRNGLPRNDTIQQTMYNNIYYKMAHPWYKIHFGDPFIPNDYETRSVIDQHSKAHSIEEANYAFRYLMRCMDYVSEQNVTLDSDKYIKEITKNHEKRRSTPISNNIKNGELSGGKQKPLLDLDLHIKDSFTYLHNVSEFEAKVYANSRAFILGHKEPYSHKTWIWSRKQKTRHSFMEGQTVPINEPFQVVNERTGEMSNLMFPRDYARDSSGANTINCGCDVHYHNNTKGYVPNGQNR